MDEQAKKNFLMKVGIISFMVLIFIFWLLNIKNVFQSSTAFDNSQSTNEWQKMKTDFNDTIDKMSKSLDKIESTNEKLKNASSSLLEELITEINVVASSTNNLSTLATSSLVEAASTSSMGNIASSSLENNSCPAYIDCMPTVGEVRPCQIPAGCEGITQIAY